MANNRLYDKFAARLGEAIPEGKTAFVNSLLDEAEDKIKDVTGRESVPAQLDSLVVKMAVIAYNMQGAEGESSRSEGGISRAFDVLPADDKARLINYPRKVGAVYANNGS